WSSCASCSPRRSTGWSARPTPRSCGPPSASSSTAPWSWRRARSRGSTTRGRPFGLPLVQGFHDEREAERREREEGVEACREAVRRAEETLESALAMQERVRAAERAARRGLTVLEDKLSG